MVKFIKREKGGGRAFGVGMEGQSSTGTVSVEVNEKAVQAGGGCRTM